ncbi:TPA: hypothetical protein SCV26_000967 [Campylobacter coli]|nr:hypothetical protein [Campylobacter coli]
MTLKQISELIKSESVKIISFDIFDTLLVRPCINPSDMFKIIATRAGLDESFIKIRQLAEQYARENKPFYEDDITIDDIYRHLHLNFELSIEECERLKIIEMEVEFDYLYPKNSIQDLFFEALENRKKVIIVSDMYLPKNFLEKVLEKNNYKNYDGLFVSGDLKISKGSGRLFDFIIAKFEKMGFDKSSILHIGDNQRADVNMPNSKGIKGVRIVNSSTRFSMLHLLDSIQYSKMVFTDNRFILGFMINKVFDHISRPYDKEHSMFNGEIENFTNLLLTPIFYAFARWLLEDCKKNNIDTLLLVYRDGYLIEKILNIFLKDRESQISIKPLRLSRKALYAFDGLSKKECKKKLVAIPASATMTVENFLKLRFLMDDFQIAEASEKYNFVLDAYVGDVKNQLTIADQVYEYFFNNAKKKTEVIKDYCRHVIADGENIAVFDVGYSGRICKFLKDVLNVETTAYHMFKHFGFKGDSSIRTYFDFSNTFFQHIHIIHNQIFEDILSEPVGTLQEIIKKNDKFDFILDNKYQAQDEILKVQDRILNNIEEFYNLFKKDIDTLNIHGFDFYHILTRFLWQPKAKDMNVFKNLTFKDDFIVGDNNIGYDKWFASKKNFQKPNEDCTVRKIVKRYYKKFKNFSFFQNFKDKLELKKQKQSLQKNIQDLFELPSKCFDDALEKKDFLFVGHFASFDKGVCRYISNAAQGKSALVVSTTPWLKKEFVQNKLKMPSIIVPKATFNRGYDGNVDLNLTESEKYILERNPRLKEISLRMKLQYKDMGKNYPDKMAIFLFQYFDILLEKTSPKKVFIWNKFNATHEILYLVCLRRNIQCVFMEFGVIPGTFNFDLQGQMGESWIANHTSDFNDLTINSNDLENAKKVLEYIYKEKLCRNLQPENNLIDNIKCKIKKDRPTIVYFGQNDFEAGMIPYNQHVVKYHSPWSIDSNDACRVLSEICIKNDWNFIYKPHPNLEWLEEKKSEIIDARGVDIHELIDLADVAVTILSQSSYEALMRGKPVVMLGYTHLKYKNCTYEAFAKDDVEQILDKAIKDGFTEEMRKNFHSHIARLLKYYLYDDYVARKFKYGKKIEDFQNEFLN